MDLEREEKPISRRSSRHSLAESNTDEKPASRKSSRVSQLSDQFKEEKSSRRSSVGSQIGRRSSSRRSSQASEVAREDSIATVSDSRGTPSVSSTRETPEGTKRPERIRNKKKEFSPEVSRRSSNFQKIKPRKVSASPSPSPLGKREAKRRSKYSPTPDRPGSSRSLEQTKDTCNLTEGLKKIMESLSQENFTLPDWVISPEFEKMKKTVVEAEPSTSAANEEESEVEEEEVKKDEEPEEKKHPKAKRKVAKRSESMEEDVESFAAHPVPPQNRKRSRTLRDTLAAEFATPPPTEEKLSVNEMPAPPVDIKRRRSRAERIVREEEPKEPATKRTKRTQSIEPEEEATASTPQPEEDGRRSRRSRANFEEFMTQITGSKRPEPVQTNKPKAGIKLARTKKPKEEKEESKGTKDAAEEPKEEKREFKSDKPLPPSPPEKEEMTEEPQLEEKASAAKRRSRNERFVRKPEEKKEEKESKVIVKIETDFVDEPEPLNEVKIPILRRRSRTERLKQEPLSPSPPPSSIRRSGRNSIPSTKLLDMVSSASATPKSKKEEPVEAKETPKFKVKAKPGSALEILKKTSQYKRIERSPSPPSSAQSTAASSSKTTPEKPKETKPVVEEKVPEKNIPMEINYVEEKPFANAPSFVEEKPFAISTQFVEEKPFAATSSTSDPQAAPKPQDLETVTKSESTDIDNDEMEEFVVEDEEPVKSSSSKRPMRGMIKITKTKKNVPQPSEPRRSPEKKPEIDPVVESTQPTRRSGRALKPKISSDYVFEVPVVIRKDAQPSREVELASPAKSPVKTPTKSPAKTSLKSPSPAKKSGSATKEPEMESSAERTRKYLEEHKGTIKLSFKFGSEVAVVKRLDEEGEETREEEKELEELVEEETEEESKEKEQGEPVEKAKPVVAAPPPKSHVKKSREPSWWTNYTPTPKPVLENFIRPDGTVEHLGVVINSVMDNLLLKVCDDGIRRHSNNRAREARKQEMSEMAKKRYHEKKKIAEERLARGEIIEPPKKTSAELFAHTISTRERTKKGALYRSNEFLLKPVKLQRELDMEREKQEQEARDYLNRQFMREAEEDLRNEKRSKRSERRENKSIKHVTFKEFIEKKGEKTAEVFRSNSNPDFFHREILREPEDISIFPEADIDNTELPSPTNEAALNFMEQAKSTADQICVLLCRRLNQYGGCDIYDMLERVREEPDLRQAIIANTIEVLIEFQQVQLGNGYSANAAVTMHNEAIRRAYDLRDAFSINNAEWETMTWAHGFLLQNLPIDYLSGYLILLRYWKYQPASPVTSFAKKAFLEDAYPWPQITEIVWSYIMNRLIDPDRENIQATINVEALSDVIFVLVPPAFQYGDYSFTTKAHDTLFRWLKSMGSKESYIMRMDYDGQATEIWEVLDFYIKKIKNDIQKLVRETRDKRIVLVGWRLSCYLNHRVVQLIHGVSAIIDLAFCMKTSHGFRGAPDDDILLTYCPSLFIVGSHSTSFNAIALKEMRTHMQTETGSVVIHYADDHLYVPSYVLNRYNITQRTIYRSIIEYIVEFLNLPATKKERSQLIQVDLNCVYNVEIDALKPSGTITSLPQKISQQRATTDGKPSVSRPRKRKNDPPPLTMPNPPAMPSLLAESSIVTTAEARYRFDEIVRSARAINPPDMSPLTPKTAPAAYKNLNSPMASPKAQNPSINFRPTFVVQPPPPSNLSNLLQPASSQASQMLDPANISLN